MRVQTKKIQVTFTSGRVGILWLDMEQKMSFITTRYMVISTDRLSFRLILCIYSLTYVRTNAYAHEDIPTCIIAFFFIDIYMNGSQVKVLEIVVLHIKQIIVVRKALIIYYGISALLNSLESCAHQDLTIKRCTPGV